MWTSLEVLPCVGVIIYSCDLLKEAAHCLFPKYIPYRLKCQLCLLPLKEAAGNISLPLLGRREGERGDKGGT